MDTTYTYDLELEFCEECRYYGEPNGCNKPDGECKAYRATWDMTEELLEYRRCAPLSKVQEWARAEQEGRLVVLPEFTNDDYDGLKAKYRVYKARNGEPVDNCFILRPDKDRAARTALSMYAQKCGNETLRLDILNWLQQITREAAEAALKEAP